MRWEYHKKNICTDYPVAVGFNDNDIKICYVKESRDAYYTEPCVDYLKSVYLTYAEAQKMNNDKEEKQEDAKDVLFSAIKHACEYFESDYEEQKEKIKRTLF